MERAYVWLKLYSITKTCKESWKKEAKEKLIHKDSNPVGCYFNMQGEENFKIQNIETEIIDFGLKCREKIKVIAP